jgi:hypothetical protein
MDFAHTRNTKMRNVAMKLPVIKALNKLRRSNVTNIIEIHSLKKAHEDR